MSFPGQVVKNRFHRIFLPSHSLDTVSSVDMLFCFEVLSKELTKEKVVLLRVHQVSQLCCKHSKLNFFHIECLFLCSLTYFHLHLQRLQVPSIPVAKCAACQKPPLSDEEKLRRCTRCYRVGYCNQWVMHSVSGRDCGCGVTLWCHRSKIWKHILLWYRACQKNHWPNHKSLCRPNFENVGQPFLISVPESRLTYTRLTQLLEGYSRYAEWSLLLITFVWM